MNQLRNEVSLITFSLAFLVHHSILSVLHYYNGNFSYEMLLRAHTTKTPKFTNMPFLNFLLTLFCNDIKTYFRF